MKTTAHIRDLLGFTQLEMAIALGITRAQLSMFESGKRDLSTDAKLRLAEILRNMQGLELKRRDANRIFGAAKKEQELSKRLKENEYQYEKLARKIVTVQRKRAVHFTKLQSLEQLTTSKDAGNASWAKVLNLMAQDTLKKLEDEVLYQLEIQSKVLLCEKSLLEEELQKLRESVENTGVK